MYGYIRSYTSKSRSEKQTTATPTALIKATTKIYYQKCENNQQKFSTSNQIEAKKKKKESNVNDKYLLIFLEASAVDNKFFNYYYYYYYWWFILFYFLIFFFKSNVLCGKMRVAKTIFISKIIIWKIEDVKIKNIVFSISFA